ncbi:MAG: prepilin-type N-terminal cleavage/methylation domain-containing protein [Gemmatimonadetes bacterium]|nr:prepilin-type N-terminal cleavage/methylation domain-containing protein [Gemmatimonadota bacterium]
MRNSKGFTLVELMIAATVTGIMGVALTQMLIHNSRFVAHTEAMMNARQVARAAMNVMGAELAMVSTGGLYLASSTSITLRVPYAFGIICAQTSQRVASMVPTDSIMYASASASGLAWRDDMSDDYTFMAVSNVQPAPSGTEMAKCTNQGISILTDGTTIKMTITPDTLSIGDVFYLYQDVRYQFASSADLTGRLGLWRKRGLDADEEILAPFDNASSFAFFVGSAATAQASPPSDLTTVVGLELNLVGSSEVTPLNSSQPPSFEISTRVNFLTNQ